VPDETAKPGELTITSGYLRMPADLRPDRSGPGRPRPPKQSVMLPRRFWPVPVRVTHLASTVRSGEQPPLHLGPVIEVVPADVQLRVSNRERVLRDIRGARPAGASGGV
jgi:hypothetical protein